LSAEIIWIITTTQVKLPRGISAADVAGSHFASEWSMRVKGFIFQVTRLWHVAVIEETTKDFDLCLVSSYSDNQVNIILEFRWHTHTDTKTNTKVLN